MANAVIGWDIGGAHVKAVWLDDQGCVQDAVQWPCALWKGLHLLDQALVEVMAAFGLQAKDIAHVVTMTGELVDLFTSREAGVQAIADCVRAQFPNVRFYAADASGARFVASVDQHTAAIASMNWHASALCVAQGMDANVLLVDIGSTTTDVTRCIDGQVEAHAWTDAARMATGSLLYTGVVRTPVMALGPSIAWQGHRHWIAAEYFATMADVYRILGGLHAEHDMAETADGQDKSLRASMRRLARMVGHDVEDLPEQDWIALAQAFATQQQEHMQTVCKLQLSAPPRQAPMLVGLGAGAFLCSALAQALDLAYRPAHALVRAKDPRLQALAIVCFPAYAVAKVSQSWH